MDGVLVDSECHWKVVECEFLASLVPTWNHDWQQRIIGMSLVDVHRLLVEQHNCTLSRSELVEFYQPKAREVYGEQSTLLPGAYEFVECVRSSGMKTALASSSPRNWIEIVLSRFDLHEQFDQVVSSDDVAGVGKPSPQIYLEVSRRLGCEPERCVAVEDSKNGVLAAKLAGMLCIGFRNGANATQDLSQADWEAEAGFGDSLISRVLEYANALS